MATNTDDDLWILIIDDEEKFRRMMADMLQGNLPNVQTVESSNGAEGLEALKNDTFDCVILDYKMPQKNGMQVLKEVRSAGIDIPIIVMTGFGDEHLAVDLMKAGASDYLPKHDLTADAICRAVRSAIALRESELKRVQAEKELLEKTLIGAVTTLIDMLGLVNPVALTRAARIKRYVRIMTSQLKLTDSWQFELAAILSQIGYVLIPPDLLNKAYEGKKLSDHEEQLLRTPPSIASTLLSKIPRLESIAQLIESQQKPYQGESVKDLMQEGDLAALGGHILNVAIEFDRLIEQGMEINAILEQLQLRRVTHDSDLLEALGKLEFEIKSMQVKSIKLQELAVGMVLSENVFTTDGVLLASKGQEVTYPMLRRLYNVAEGVGVLEPVWIKTTATENST